MVKILICGAGGFIGGHLASKFLKEQNNDIKLTCVDIKPIEYWFQNFEKSKNYSLDLKDYENALKVTKGIDYILISLATWVEWDLLRIIKLSVCFQY